jgi:hypothetical protein
MGTKLAAGILSRMKISEERFDCSSVCGLNSCDGSLVEIDNIPLSFYLLLFLLVTPSSIFLCSGDLAQKLSVEELECEDEEI